MSLGLNFAHRCRRPLAWLALALLASCGGGGDRVSTFAPQRLFVFGDEASVIVGSGGSVTDVDGNVITAQAGAKYSINALEFDAAGVATGALSCGANALWTQYVAARFGFGFPECPVANVATQAGRSYAQVGARVANLPAQVAAATAAAGVFTNTDLVTVMVGQRDILTAYATATSDADCTFVSGSGGSIGPVAQATRAIGVALGTQVNTIANAGGRVLIATVPNQGNTPYAYAQALLGGFSRGTCLTNLTNAFNAGLRSTIINDGRLIGLVQADEQLQVVASNPGVFGYASVSTAACATAPPACSTSTLVTGATSTNFLWADDRHFSVDAHARIGNLAVTRAINNPF